MRLNVVQKFTLLSIAATVVIAVSLSLLVTTFQTRWLLANEVRLTAQAVRMMTRVELPPETFARAVREGDVAAFENLWRHFQQLPETVRLKIYDPAGRIVWSDEAKLIGEFFADNEELEESLAGRVVAEMGKIKSEHVHETPLTPEEELLEVYVPIFDGDGGTVYSVFELYKHPRSFFRSRRVLLSTVWCAGIVGGLALFLSLYGLFHRSLREQVRLQHVEQELHDVTTQRRLEAAEREAEHDRILRDLAAGVAHNFSNLLTGMRNYAARVRRALSETDAPLDDIQIVIDTADRAARLSTDLRRWVEPVDERPWPATLKSIVASLVTRCRETLPENVALDVSVDAPQTCIEASPDSLLTALSNVCRNAQEAMPEGGTLTISAGRACSGDEHGDDRFAQIVIADTGGGIPADVLPGIFEPFFSTKGTVGVGLGLSLSHHIIESQGGRIEVQSSAAEGTEFRVLLPTAPPERCGARTPDSHR